MIDEATAQIVEALLNGVQSSLDASEDFQSLWMNWSWMHITGNEYVLVLSIEGYDPQENTEVEIPDDAQEKIEQAIHDAFGEDVDWDSIQDEMNQTATTEDGFSEYTTTMR